MRVGAKLTELEECLATLYFLKHASPSCDQTHLQRVWGITKAQYVLHSPAITHSAHAHHVCHTHVCRCERILKLWSPRWTELGKEHCILDLRNDPELFKFHQPVDFAKKYGRVIATELDGTTVKHDKSRAHSVKARSSYCDKYKWQATQGLTWTTVIGT